jgi:thiol-disulfide isomerase/thioredoxin
MRLFFIIILRRKCNEKACSKKDHLMKFPIDKNNWRLGLELDQFVEGMQTNQLHMKRRLKTVHLSAAEAGLLLNIDHPAYVLVMSEDWCVDSLMTLPILVRIVEAAPHLELRIFVRHERTDLNAYFQERGIINIPVFMFLDADFKEVGIWVERSKAASERLAEWVSAHPAYEAIRTAAELSREEKRARLAPFLAERQLEMEDWYQNGLQSTAVAEIAALFGGN